MRWSANSLASPPRKHLNDDHREFLSSPNSHGMNIEKFTASDGTPCLICTPAATIGSRGKSIRAQMFEQKTPVPALGKVTGTLVLLHGRTGRKEDFLPIAERFCAVGFRCIVPDLPAHGDSPKKFTTYGIQEAYLPALILNESARHFHFSPQPCGLMGISMGGSIAVHSAAMPDAPWKALVIISSFDTLEANVKRQISSRKENLFSEIGAAGIASIYKMKTGTNLSDIRPFVHAARIHVPTLIAHGTQDTVISSASGRRLFESIPSSTETQWIDIPSANHSNVFVTNYPIYASMAKWMMGHL